MLGLVNSLRKEKRIILAYSFIQQRQLVTGPKWKIGRNPCARPVTFNARNWAYLWAGRGGDGNPVQQRQTCGVDLRRDVRTCPNPEVRWVIRKHGALPACLPACHRSFDVQYCGAPTRPHHGPLYAKIPITMGWLTIMDREWEHIKHFCLVEEYVHYTVLLALRFIAASI